MEMENKYQICEIKDDTKSFIELSVSAVPEIWIFKDEGGTIWCYWPKYNALKKIKSFEQPKPGRGWTTYKCRILMNEEKFSTYETALEAEKYCQNFSILMDTTETENADTQRENENVCNGTMNFDVSFQDDDDYDSSDNETPEVGNDTFMFNKKIAKGGRYCTKNSTIRTNFYCNDETLEERVDDLYDSYDSEDSEKSDCSSRSKKSVDKSDDVADDFTEKIDYSIHFKNATSISSSTLLEVNALEPNNDDLPNDDTEAFVSMISKIETNVLSFFNSFQKDIHELKKIAKSLSEKQKIEPGSSRQGARLDRINHPTSNGTCYIGEDPETREKNPAQITQINPDEPINERSKHNRTSNESGNALVKVVQEVVNCNTSIQMAGGASKRVMNASLPRDIPNKKARTDVAMSNTSVPIAQVIENAEIIFVPHVPNIPNEKSKNRALDLPIHNPDHYNENETLLEDSGLETAMIEHLSPLQGEDEATYINRTVGVLFEDNFFIDKITWKPQENQVCIKGSNLLCCWKESHAKIFPDDKENQRFIKNFRRIKSAKRAKKKAEEKKKLKNSKNVKNN